MSEVVFDASEIEALSRAIGRLPEGIKTKAMASAMRRMRDMARTRFVKRNAERVNIQQKYVREVTTAYFNAGGNTIDLVERSGWIPVYKMNPQLDPDARGISVRFLDARGSYKQAFIAKMKSGHEGVFKRVGSARLPIREMFGPNPAHDVTNNPEVYLDVLAEIIQDHLAPRFLHELDRLLPR